MDLIYTGPATVAPAYSDFKSISDALDLSDIGYYDPTGAPPVIFNRGLTLGLQLYTWYPLPSTISTDFPQLIPISNTPSLKSPPGKLIDSLVIPGSGTNAYDDFKSLVQSFGIDKTVFYGPNSGSGYDIWAFDRILRVSMHVVGLPSIPSSFSTDFPTAVSLNTMFWMDAP